jgi:hypothetical protein
LSFWLLIKSVFKRRDRKVEGDFTAEYFRSRVMLADDGVTFIWKLHPGDANGHRAWDAQWAGKPVRVELVASPGAPDHVYAIVRFMGKYYGLHRLMWLYQTGEWPRDEIDHRDNDTLNWRFDNLREATHGQNQMNSGPMRNNLLGVKGVYRRKRGNCVQYLAQIHVPGTRETRHIGSFKTEAEAVAAYRKIAAELHGEFLHRSQKEE